MSDFTQGSEPLKKKILVVGLTCVDIKNVVDCFPKEDQKMSSSSQIWTIGGNAVNTACVLAQHSNVKVDLLSGLSSHKKHLFVVDELVEAGVNIDLCMYRDTLLPTCTCILNLETGLRTILFCQNNFPQLQLTDFSKVNIMEYDWIHFEGRDFPDVGHMINSVIKTRGMSTKPIISGEMESIRRLEHLNCYVLPFVDVVIISKDIAFAKSYKSALEAVKTICNNAGIKARFVICPWGDKGAAGAQLVGDVWGFYECDAHYIEKVVDTLGAGDTFNAGLIFSLLMDENCLNAIKYACKMAGQKCGQIGFQNLISL